MSRDTSHLYVEVAVAAAAGDESALARHLRRALHLRLPLRRVREALFQQVVFIGIGRTINAFSVLDRMRRGSSRLLRADRIAPAGPRSPRSSDSLRRRGEAVCRRVYGGDYPALRARMRRLHPDLDAWMIEEGYGKVMARPGLDLRLRERMAVGVLAVMRLWPQLRSHLEGARRLGVRETDIRRALAAAGKGLSSPDRRRLDLIRRRQRIGT